MSFKTKKKAGNKNNKERDLIIVILLNLLGVFLAYVSRNTFFAKPLVVQVLLIIFPVIYLLSKKRENLKETLLSTLLIGAGIGYLIDFMGEYTKMWTVKDFIFPIKILGVEPLDNLIWWTMMTFYTIIFYEHFFDYEKYHHISKHFKILSFGVIIGIVIQTSIFFFLPAWFNISYPYLIIGLLAIMLPIVVCFIKPRLLSKMVMTGLYFFVLYFIYELFAMTNAYWVYPRTDYIGQVTFMGLMFPFEEFFFWMMLYAPSIIAAHEVFVDDCK